VRLRTEIHGDKMFVLGNCFHQRGVDRGIDEIAHDAAIAHALVMAMPDGSFKDSVMRKADELMREWGYSDET
jgi:hypothetical protein